MNKFENQIQKAYFKKRSQIRVIGKHIPILAKPLVFSFTSLFIWGWMRKSGIYFSPKSETLVLTGPVLFLTTIYGIMVTITVAIIWKIYSKVSSSIIDHDKNLFLRFRDEKIPIMFHFLVAIPGLLLLYMLMKIHYEEVEVGEHTIVSVSYVMGLFYIVAVELSDPKRSIWIKDRIPAEWLTVDIDIMIQEKIVAKKKEEQEKSITPKASTS